MAYTIETLRNRMEAAALAQDFEEAARLRDQINLIRGGASLREAERADTTGLKRLRPGAMGLGTSQQSAKPLPGSQPPPKPDPLTRGRPKRLK